MELCKLLRTFVQFAKSNVIVLMVILLALMLATFELALMEVKYGVFRGGFLQSHRIQSIQLLFLFILTLFTSTLLFIWFLQTLFFSCCARSSIQQEMLIYHFVWIVGGGLFLVISGRYELGKYFSDFLDFQVVKNLGGGNLGDALLYVLEDGLAYVFLFLAIAALYVAGHFFMLRVVETSKKPQQYAVSTLRWSCVVFVLQGVLIIAVNQNADFRYNLNRTTVYRVSRMLMDELTDFDRDGYGLFAWQQDLAPFDGEVYPLALDILSDGIDQDGIGGDFQYQGSDNITNTCQFNANLNIVIIVLESARADALEKTIAGHKVMPNLIHLAQEGGAAKSYFSHTAYTTSSLSALFTGRLTPNNQLEHSMFKCFKEAGYQIGIFSGQDESFGDVDKYTGMHRYSNYYFDAKSAKTDRVFSSAAQGSLTLSNDRVIDEMFKAEIINWTKPFFIYINLQAGHFPYYYPGMPLLLTKEPLSRNLIKPENQSRLLETYYNSMAYDDEALGRVIKELKIRGIYDKTLLVVSGDHGESLFDDGFLGHGHFINNIQMRTILVSNKSLPGLDMPIGQIDLSRMIYHYLTQVDLSSFKINNGVFHFIGSLQQPSLIGISYQDNDKIILNLESREIQTSLSNNWIPESIWMNDEALKAKTEKLAKYWETLRWEDHVSRHRNNQ